MFGNFLNSMPPLVGANSLVNQLQQNLEYAAITISLPV